MENKKLEQATPPMDEVVDKLKDLVDKLSYTDATLQAVVNKLGMYSCEEKCGATGPCDLPDWARYDASTTLYQLNSLCETLEARYKAINALTNQLKYFIG